MTRLSLRPMYRRSTRLLVLLIALISGLSPVQAAFASMSGTPDTRHDSHHVAGQSVAVDAMIADLKSSTGCDRCNANDCCEGATCGNGHCASCAVPLPTSVQQVGCYLLLPSPVTHEERFTGSPAASLFRPPRA